MQADRRADSCDAVARIELVSGSLQSMLNRSSLNELISRVHLVEFGKLISEFKV